MNPLKYQELVFKMRRKPSFGRIKKGSRIRCNEYGRGSTKERDSTNDNKRNCSHDTRLQREHIGRVSSDDNYRVLFCETR